MDQCARPPVIERLKGLYQIIRIAPVLSWGISSSLVGLGCAYALTGSIRWADYILILLLITIIHGVVSHAFNDREDWLSGTDRLTRGILSGGSRVIARGLYNTEELSSLGRKALVITVVGALFLAKAGPGIVVFLALGIWAALAYTCPPFRLAYRPLVGEWLCGVPAVLACATGTYYVLTGGIHPLAVAGGAIHALLAIGLLMHHHLADITGDLQALPHKLTTVAFTSVTLGIDRAPWVELVYFTLALVTGLAAGWLLHPVFWLGIPFALGCMAVALATQPLDTQDITCKEYYLYWLVTGDAVAKAVFLMWPGKG